MARGSPIFIVFVIMIVAVSFVFVITQMHAHTPTGGAYSDPNSSANVSQQYLNQAVDQAPNFIVPAIVVSVALLILFVVFLFKRR